jgi:cyclase
VSRRIRVIPVLTVDNEKLVKTVKFKKPNYIGDPVNAVKIFNEKEVDEIVLLDITATKQKREPNYSKIEEICSEAFMPFAYGGGITNINQIDLLFKLGIEKVVINTMIAENLKMVRQAADKFGSQSIVASIDIKKNVFGKYHAYTNSGDKKVFQRLDKYLEMVLNSGVGELMINSVNRDGTFLDYDYDLIELICKKSKVPTIACGGASNLNSFKQAINSGASAVAAGSLFVYRGETKGILINFPSQEDLKSKVFEGI